MRRNKSKKLIKELEKTGCQLLYQSGESYIFRVDTDASEVPYKNFFPFAVVENGEIVDAFITLENAIQFLEA